jgi:hypothetical protein
MSTLRVNNITDTSGGSSSLSVPGAAKAWVNFNGTGTVAIRAQMNVSSITDNGVGDYTVNFTTALVDANYTTNITGARLAGTYNSIGVINMNTPTYSTTAVRFWMIQTNDTLLDSAYVNVVIFR